MNCCAAFVCSHAAHRRPLLVSRNLAELLHWWEAGRLHPLVAKTFPLAEAGAAMNECAAVAPLRRQDRAGSVSPRRRLRPAVIVTNYAAGERNWISRLAMARDLELVERLDWLGFDEAWIGAHHSAGWEVIASPEIVIAQAADRTAQSGSAPTSRPAPPYDGKATATGRSTGSKTAERGSRSADRSHRCAELRESARRRRPPHRTLQRRQQQWPAAG
jgi:hypothetical protein